MKYLKASTHEDAISRVYYIMYYVEIMENAARIGPEALAEAMMAALEMEESTLRDILLPQRSAVIKSDVRKNVTIFEDIFSSNQKPRRYHPLEIVLWKYGSFQLTRGNETAAQRYWKAALEVCDENPDYTGMKCVALAILLEQLAVWMHRGGDTRPICREILRRSEALLKLDGLPDRMRDYAEQARDCIAQMDDAGSAGRIICLSRQIAY